MLLQSPISLDAALLLRQSAIKPLQFTAKIVDAMRATRAAGNIRHVIPARLARRIR